MDFKEGLARVRNAWLEMTCEAGEELVRKNPPQTPEDRSKAREHWSRLQQMETWLRLGYLHRASWKRNGAPLPVRPFIRGLEGNYAGRSPAAIRMDVTRRFNSLAYYGFVTVEVDAGVRLVGLTPRSVKARDALEEMVTRTADVLGTWWRQCRVLDLEAEEIKQIKDSESAVFFGYTILAGLTPETTVLQADVISEVKRSRSRARSLEGRILNRDLSDDRVRKEVERRRSTFESAGLLAIERPALNAVKIRLTDAGEGLYNRLGKLSAALNEKRRMS